MQQYWAETASGWMTALCPTRDQPQLASDADRSTVMCPVPWEAGYVERRFPDGRAAEREVLGGFLDWQRATVGQKVQGLSDADGYRSLVATSPRLTVAGVVSHLRDTERTWFAASFPSRAGTVAPLANGGWQPQRTSLCRLVEAYEDECQQSRQIVSGLDLATLQEYTPAQFRAVSVRWILTHMIDETSRHLGHLDLLRE